MKKLKKAYDKFIDKVFWENKEREKAEAKRRNEVFTLQVGDVFVGPDGYGYSVTDLTTRNFADRRGYVINLGDEFTGRPTHKTVSVMKAVASD